MNIDHFNKKYYDFIIYNKVILQYSYTMTYVLALLKKQKKSLNNLKYVVFAKLKFVKTIKKAK